MVTAQIYPGKQKLPNKGSIITYAGRHAFPYSRYVGTTVFVYIYCGPIRQVIVISKCEKHSDAVNKSDTHHFPPGFLRIISKTSYIINTRGGVVV